MNNSTENMNSSEIEDVSNLVTRFSGLVNVHARFPAKDKLLTIFDIK